MKKKIIYVDFDGVLNEYKGWMGKENLFKPRKGVEDFLKDLSENYIIYIFTAREMRKVEVWLMKYKLLIYISNITNIKEPAHAYIDDRAIRFDGDYSKILSELEGFKPYWQE